MGKLGEQRSNPRERTKAMLSREQLEGLYKKLRETDVLSVYVDGDESNPAHRRAWRTTLDRNLAAEKRRLEAEAPEAIDAFTAARSLIEEELAAHREFMPGPAWVAFATPQELHYAAGVPVPMPDLVRWEPGIRAAPYVRALKQERVVVATLVDSRKARLFAYKNGVISEREDLIADLDFGDLSESTSSHRESGQVGSTGSRGETGTDAGRRALEVSAGRMHARLVEAVSELAGGDGFFVIGGTPEAVRAVTRLASSFEGRMVERPSMHLGMTEAEVKVDLENAASELSRSVQESLLSQIVDAARSGGKGCLGIQATKEALREGRVDALLLSRGLREREGDLVDHFVGTAFEQGALVEELSSSGATRLEEAGEGVGARLRYTT
jgi:hypothetical protein